MEEYWHQVVTKESFCGMWQQGNPVERCFLSPRAIPMLFTTVTSCSAQTERCSHHIILHVVPRPNSATSYGTWHYMSLSLMSSIKIVFTREALLSAQMGNSLRLYRC